MKKKAQDSGISRILIYLILGLVVLVVIYFSLSHTGFVEFFKNFFPGYNKSSEINQDLLEDGIILGAKVKVLLNDGEGRCIIAEVSEPEKILGDYGLREKELLNYGVKEEKLFKKINENNEWEDVDYSVASEEEVFQNKLRDALYEKSQSLILKYNNKDYPLKLGFLFNYKHNGLVAKIDDVNYLWNRNGLFKKISNNIKGCTSSKLPCSDLLSSFSKFNNFVENSFTFLQRSSQLDIETSFKDGDAVYSILFVEINGKKYGVDYRGNLFQKDKDKWEKIIDSRDVFRFREFLRNYQLKKDLMKACYED